MQKRCEVISWSSIVIENAHGLLLRSALLEGLLVSKYVLVCAIGLFEDFTSVRLTQGSCWRNCTRSECHGIPIFAILCRVFTSERNLRWAACISLIPLTECFKAFNLSTWSWPIWVFPCNFEALIYSRGEWHLSNLPVFILLFFLLSKAIFTFFLNS